MKIISNFKDYYDSGAAYGVDTSVLYKRLPADIKSSKEAFSVAKRWCNNVSNSVSRIVIGFCGEVYPCVIIVDYEDPARKIRGYTSVDDYRQLNLSTPYYCCYDMSHVDTALSVLRRNINKRGRQTHDYSNATTIQRVQDRREVLVEFFSEVKYNKELLDAFTVYNTPVYTYVRRNRLFYDTEAFRVHPFLFEWQFQKVKTPIEAFQQIQSYISGVLGTSQNETVTISDKDQVYKKGFDPKYGFRKRPANV